MFGPYLKWWYWKILVMGAIGITFLNWPLRFMSYNISCLCMNSSKSIKTLMGG
jgi:hypothetical protein